jgi:hypothetical protein
MGALKVRSEGGVTFFEGVLDEEAPPVLDATAAKAAPSVTFDVSGVKRINSLGVRAWVDFMKSLGGRAVMLRRCSPAFVDQLNSVSDFRGNASVHSFLAPFVCERSGDVFYEEFVVGKDIKKGDFAALLGKRCDACPEPLVFDDLPERYLHFLQFV